MCDESIYKKSIIKEKNLIGTTKTTQSHVGKDSDCDIYTIYVLIIMNCNNSSTNDIDIKFIVKLEN